MIPKFKAWKKTNCPEMFEDIRVIDFEENIIRIGYKLSEYTTRVDEESLDNVILLQSTGLKDKNGTEIFEGDILSVSKNHNKTDSRVFNDEKVNYRAEFLTYDDMEAYADIEHYGWCATGSIDKWSTRCTLIDAVKLWDAEILGNIYEHPHLLEEE